METFLLLIYSFMIFTAVTTAQTFYPCQNHTVLKDETWRTVAANITLPWGSHHCDTRIPIDWLRFDSPSGGKMLEHCPPMLHCGTVFPVWLNGTHPTVAEGQVSRKACSHVYGVCCDPSYVYAVQIVNCGAYYVYKLPRVANCNAYCIGQEKPCPAGQTSPTGYTPGCQVSNATSTSPSTSPSQPGGSSSWSLTTSPITSTATPSGGPGNTTPSASTPGPSTSTTLTSSSQGGSNPGLSTPGSVGSTTLPGGKSSAAPGASIQKPSNPPITVPTTAGAQRVTSTSPTIEGGQEEGFNHYTSLYAVIGVLIFILAAVIGSLLFLRLTGRMEQLCQKKPRSETYASASYQSSVPGPAASDHVYLSLPGQGPAQDSANPGAASVDFPKHFDNPPAYESDYSYAHVNKLSFDAKSK